MNTSWHYSEIGTAVSATIAPARKSTESPDTDKNLFQGETNYIVVVYDNDKNSYDEVILILQKATACTLEEAYTEAWEVDHLGKSVVHHGSKEECKRVAGIIRSIGIRVEVLEE